MGYYLYTFIERLTSEQMMVKSGYRKNPSNNQGSEYVTPIVQQLKKSKLVDNQSCVSNQKEELKKLFGFEVKEIKKSGSNTRSTERPVNDNPVYVQPKPQNTKPADKNNYWGRGYHLNYPSYAQ